MGELTLFLPLIVIMGAFMFFASRRQKKAMQATINLHDSLVPGDEIMTTAGIFGTITDVSDTKVDLEVAPGIVMTMLKLAVKEKVSDDLDDAEDADEAIEEYEDGIDHPGLVNGSPTSASAIELDRPTSGTEVRSDPDRLAKD